jgi:hypothetical protein
VKNDGANGGTCNMVCACKRVARLKGVCVRCRYATLLLGEQAGRSNFFLRDLGEVSAGYKIGELETALGPPALLPVGAVS